MPGPAERELVRGVGGKIRYTYHIIPTIAAAIPEQAIPGLKANPKVIHVHLDGRVYALDAELNNSWGVDRIDAEVVHEALNKGSGVKVAIIDTGIDYYHEDLDGNYWGGYDFVHSDDDPMDDNGHGTHVAGITAAEDNGIGVVGVAPEADLYALKVLDANGAGFWSDVIAAIEWSMGYELDLDDDETIDTKGVKVDVVNMSLGGPGSDDLEAACQAAYDAGLLLVAAAGNSGNPPGRADNIIAPASYESVIAVAATDKDDTRARWSSTGPDLELSAPGVEIYSTYLGGDYETHSGTSMASPHVAGTAALVIASGITDANGDGFINDDVRLCLQQTADDLGTTGWDPQYGYGLVDAEQAALETEDGNNLPGAIAGKVTDAETDAAIGGAMVAVEGTSLSATTDANGDYTIADVAEGTYTVTASAEGYENASQEVTVSAGAMSIADFALTPVAKPTGTISGTVTDADTTDPIEGATVTAEGYSTTTAADGTYTLADLPVGSYTVTASATGYVDESKTADVLENQTTVVDFALSPEPTGTISGTVTDADTTDPIEGATVTADGYSTATTANGTYTLADLPVGSYTVTASATGYVEQSKTAEVLENQTTVVNFALTPVAAPTMTVASINFATVRGTDLITTVKILDESNDPVNGARVEMILEYDADGVGDADKTWSFAGDTDKNGEVEFKLKWIGGLKDGYYTATVTKVGHTDYEWDGVQKSETCYIVGGEIQ